MVHAAVAEAQPGEVLVLTMPEPTPIALVGELIATQAKTSGVAAILVDGAVRDLDELRELGPSGLGALRARARRREAGSRRDRRDGARSAARRFARATSSCSMPTAPSWSSASASRRCWPPRRSASSASSEKRPKLAGGRVLVRPRRPAAARRAVTEAAARPGADRARRAAHSEARGEPPLLRRRARDGGGGARGAVRLSARLGRLPALQPQADRGRAGRARAPGAAGVEPRGARAPGRGARDERIRHGLDRRRRRPRAGVPLHRSRRSRLRGLLRGRALRGARAPPAVLAEPAPAVRRPGGGGQAARPRQRARRGCARQPGLRPGAARVPPLRADRARRWHRGRRVAEPLDRGARADLRRRRLRGQRPSSPPCVLGRHARGVPARRRPFRGQRDLHRGRALEARDRPGVLRVRATSRAGTGSR